MAFVTPVALLTAPTAIGRSATCSRTSICRVRPVVRMAAQSAQDTQDAEENVQGTAIPPPEAGVTDINLEAKDQPLMRAGYAGDEQGMREALAAGGSPLAADVSRRTPLHFAAAHGLRAVCEELIEAGAELDAQDMMGYTALHMATTYERPDSVRALLKAGADANKAAFDTNESLPVEIAEQLLEQAQAKPSIFGFSLAAKEVERRKELVRILDDATEMDPEDPAASLQDDNATVVVVRKVESPAAAAAGVTPPAGNTASAPLDDAQVTVRVRAPAAAASVETKVEDDNALVEAQSEVVDNKDVALKPSAEQEGAPKIADDAKVTIRVRGKTVER